MITAERQKVLEELESWAKENMVIYEDNFHQSLVTCINFYDLQQKLTELITQNKKGEKDE